MDLRQQPQQKKRKGHFFRNTLVVIGAIIVTSVAVNATDNFGNLRDSVLGSVASSVSRDDGPCDPGMVFVSSPSRDFCIDRYEVSPSKGCVFEDPSSSSQTQTNLSSANCFPESKENATPWTYVSHTQAIEACAKAGKHLPSNHEWFLASLGTPDRDRNWGASDCNVANNWGGGKGATGSGSSCRSSWGAHDMIGNVWEWTFETVQQGSYKGMELPEAGFVNGVTEEGVPTETVASPNKLYFEDRFWTSGEGTTGVFRGGFYGNYNDAGRYAFHTEIPVSFTGDAVGFRCAK